MQFFDFTAILQRFYGHLGKLASGPNFEPSCQIFNGNKMVNNGCINLKFGMYKLHTYIFSTKKYIFLDRDIGQNAKTG